jgi:plastocyanin
VIGTNPSNNTHSLFNREPTTTITHVGIDIPDGNGVAGLLLFNGGTVSDFRVEGATPGARNATGASISGNATLDDGFIDGPYGQGGSGISRAAGGTVVVRNVRASGATGIDLEAGSATLANIHTTGSDAGVAVHTGANVSIVNSRIRLSGTPTSPGRVHALQASGADVPSVTGRHLTIVGSGRANTVGVASVATDGTSKPYIALSDSVVSGFPVARMADGTVGGVPRLRIDWSLWNPAADRATGAGQLVGDNDVAGEPTFVDAAAGDYRLRAGSLGIDAGTPGPLGGAEATTDIDGEPRLVDGDGDGNARRDMGAFEYGRRAPSVTVSPATGSATVGTPVTFTATGKDPDGDALTYEWSFSDGGAASGPQATHAFTTPGRHTAIVVVHDSTGLTQSFIARIEVAAAPLAAGDLTPPAISLRAKRVRATSTGIVRLWVLCGASEPEPCRGTVALSLRVKAKGSRKIRSLAAKGGGFAIESGKRKLVGTRLSRAGLRELHRRGRATAQVTVTAKDSAGNVRTLKKSITVLRAKKRKAR